MRMAELAARNIVASAALRRRRASRKEAPQRRKDIRHPKSMPARRLHYDLRLESAACSNPGPFPRDLRSIRGTNDWRFRLEDHPFEYATFEGNHPEGTMAPAKSSSGTKGTYEPEGALSAQEQLERGELKFSFTRPQIEWKLRAGQVETQPKARMKWLLIKHPRRIRRPAVECGRTRRVGCQRPSSTRDAKGEEIRPGLYPTQSRASCPSPEALRCGASSRYNWPSSRTNLSPTRTGFSEIKWDGIRTVAFVTTAMCAYFHAPSAMSRGNS